jgi:hypothetical protein
LKAWSGGIAKIGVIGISTMGNGIAGRSPEYFNTVMDINMKSSSAVWASSEEPDRLVRRTKPTTAKGASAPGQGGCTGKPKHDDQAGGSADRDIIIEARAPISEELNRNIAKTGYDRLLVSNAAGSASPGWRHLRQAGAVHGMHFQIGAVRQGDGLSAG